MPLQYVDVALQEKLKEMAQREERTVVNVLRRLVRMDAINNGYSNDTSGPTDPEARWEWAKEGLSKKCGCVFDDGLNVLSVTDWGLFRTINDGKLMETYLETHPEERSKYAAVVAEAEAETETEKE